MSIGGDGGATWSPTVPGQACPNCQSALERASLVPPAADRNCILWTDPKGPDRTNLVIRISDDETQSFTGEAAARGLSRLLGPGHAAGRDNVRAV